MSSNRGRHGKTGLASLTLVLSVSFLLSAAPAEKADSQRYREHVRFLASPELEGRGAGTEGLERAAAYITEQFKALGLEPAGADRSYLQPLVVTTGAELRGDNRMQVRADKKTVTLTVGEDYTPLSFSSVATVSGAVAFAGYGVSADAFEYDDYVHFDVKDKIVVLLRYEPPSFSKDNEEPRRGYTHHARLITKAINARQRGAKAVVLVNGTLPPEEEDALLGFGRVAGPKDAGIVMVQAKNEVVDQWLQTAGKSLADVQKEINGQEQPQSFTLPESLQLTIHVDIERQRAEVNNVLAYLPGRSDEYLIIGAHYDHLGRGNESSLAPSLIGNVHPGADDNASGTAGLLELARLFAERDEPPERGILFAAFAAEELGLLGSAQWVKEPTRPLEKAVAMINMDMIGRIRDSKVFVGGTGTGSTFEALLKEVGNRHGFTLAQSPGGYSASDNTSFVTAQVPGLFFFSGLHSDYHKPSDTWEKINVEDASRLVDMIAELGSRLVAAEERAEFIKVDTPGSARAGGGQGYGPYFGSVPDFGQSEEGVRFADIRPGSPADKAGLQAGDVLIQFGDIPIKNLYDFTYALRDSKVGDVVEVKCLREGKTITAEVRLEPRR